MSSTSPDSGRWINHKSKLEIFTLWNLQRLQLHKQLLIRLQRLKTITFKPLHLHVSLRQNIVYRPLVAGCSTCYLFQDLSKIKNSHSHNSQSSKTPTVTKSHWFFYLYVVVIFALAAGGDSGFRISYTSRPRTDPAPPGAKTRTLHTANTAQTNI